MDKKSGHMYEMRDPRIKLFGKTIELTEPDGGGAAVPITAAEDCAEQDLDCSSNSVLEDSNCRRDKEERGSCKSPNHAVDETGCQFSTIDDSTGHSSDTDTGSMKLSNAEEDHLETNNSQEKSLKKPDKILPCPRCNSMDTKFCYFNNYNVSQPRHFCKNCQRYWTAGGTMRNVPVGAGRRKNKNAVSLIRQLTIPEAARVEISNGIHHKGTTLLTFSSDSALCESMASALSSVDKTTGFCKHEAAGISVSHCSKENGDDPSCGSSSVAASSKDEASKSGLPPTPMMPYCHSFVQQVPSPCYLGTPWPFNWNSVQWRPSGSPPTYPASFQMPLYSAPPPPPYWGCGIPPGSWSVPWIIPPTLVASQSHTTQNSPTLGKHSRDDTILKQKDEEEVIRETSTSEKCLWVPKTLRINDPGEAAKSSIWATLGIKNDRDDSVGGRGLFKAFQPQSKGSEKSPAKQTCPVLQANPAAFSRSVSFREST